MKKDTKANYDRTVKLVKRAEKAAEEFINKSPITGYARVGECPIHQCKNCGAVFVEPQKPVSSKMETTAPVGRDLKEKHSTGKSYYDLPIEEQKAIVNKAAKDSNKAQRELIGQSQSWESRLHEIRIGACECKHCVPSQELLQFINELLKEKKYA